MKPNHRVFRQKCANGIANSVDRDQTAPIWVCTVCQDLSVGKLIDHYGKYDNLELSGHSIFLSTYNPSFFKFLQYSQIQYEPCLGRPDCGVSHQVKLKRASSAKRDMLDVFFTKWRYSTI